MGPLATIALIAGDLTVIGAALGWGWRRLGAVRQMAVDWHGTPERRDPTGTVIDPARPGVPGRLVRLEDKVCAIDKEMHPNAGTSARDAINRLEAMVRDLQRQMGEQNKPAAAPADAA